jgi:hypothetical protein
VEGCLITLIVFVSVHTAIVLCFGWCFKFLVRRNWFRGHHTQRVITTMLGWGLSGIVMFQYPLPDNPSTAEAMVIGLVVSGPLALGIGIFGNPPPLEDEEENG